jgi:hypothetical protein
MRWVVSAVGRGSRGTAEGVTGWSTSEVVSVLGMTPPGSISSVPEPAGGSERSTWRLAIPESDWERTVAWVPCGSGA